jgi:hypothetical protein
MAELDPLTAADMARGVYGIIDDTNVARALASKGVGGLGNLFDLSQATVAQGTSGLGSFKKDTGFAMVLPGKNSRQGELAVVTRGTAMKYDWLSNFNAAWTSGPTGHTVHSGFKQIFDSIERAVNTALHGKNPSTIHCVGHSLGGALANLFAAKLSTQGHGVSLYTFGAPRVGMQGMSEYLETKLKTDIFRVYNGSDPVPLVPTYPYMHTPMSRGGLRVSTGGALFSINAHSMTTYISAVKGKSWNSLADSPTPRPLHTSIDQWPDKAAEHVRFPGSSIALSLLSKALTLIIDFARATFGITVTIGTTLIDLLAMLLYKAANLSIEMGKRLMRWIGLVMKYVGKKAVSAGKDLSQAFLRWVLELLLRPLVTLARRAVHHATQSFP